jgi:WD40 repeat protein
MKCSLQFVGLTLLGAALLASASDAQSAGPAAGKPVRLRMGFYPWAVAWSPDGTTLLAGGDSDTFGAVSLDGKKVRRIRVHNRHLGDFGLAISPDGRRWASSSDDSTIVVGDMTTHEELFTLRSHTRTVQSVAFSPDGTQLVSAGDDHAVRVWDLARRKEVAALKGYVGVRCARFAPDGKTIALASDDGGLSFWDTDEPRKVLYTSGKHTKRIQGLAYSPDSKTVATGGADGNVLLWDVATGKCLGKLAPCKDGVTNVAISPDGKTLAVGCWDATVRLYDLGTQTETTILKGHAARVFGVAFAADGRTLATGSADHTVMLWKIGQ